MTYPLRTRYLSVLNKRRTILLAPGFLALRLLLFRDSHVFIQLRGSSPFRSFIYNSIIITAELRVRYKR